MRNSLTIFLTALLSDGLNPLKTALPLVGDTHFKWPPFEWETTQPCDSACFIRCDNSL